MSKRADKPRVSAFCCFSLFDQSSANFVSMKEIGDEVVLSKEEALGDNINIADLIVSFSNQAGGNHIFCVKISGSFIHVWNFCQYNIIILLSVSQVTRESYWPLPLYALYVFVH